MDIGYGYCVALGVHQCIFDCAMRYVWTYGMCSLSGAGVIQALQGFFLYERILPSKFYTDFDKRIIQGAAYKWLPSNVSKIMAAP